MDTIQIKGPWIEDLLEFIEDEQRKPDNGYVLSLKEHRIPSSTILDAAPLEMLAINIEQIKFRKLLGDYFVQRSDTQTAPEIYTITNDAGLTLEINPDIHSIDEIKNLINKFNGQITEVNSTR